MTTELPYLSQLLNPLQDCLTHEVAVRISALRADASVQSRLDNLASRNAEGTITPEERSDYESLVSAGNLIAVLQAKARAVLIRKPPPHG
jgi:hypothetical protein